MDVVDSWITLATGVAVLGGITIIILNWVRSMISNRRMYRMMLSCGIDEDTAKYPDQLLDIDMNGVRRRCRACPVPETCDRWLRGEAVPSNGFCPNVWHFMGAVQNTQDQPQHEPRHRPGRRLDDL